jgi:DNA-binding transcriptional MerR regulator
MKVGELASRTGLSVRTLHHYDEIGLLRPSRRTPSGHRVYGLAEVRRLQQIASLRHLGLSLGEVRECLERPEYSLERVLGLQIERIRKEIARQKRLAELLESLRRSVVDGRTITVEDVTSAIEGTLHFEKYYTPEQRAAIARRAEEVGKERIEQGQRDWAELFDAFAGAMRRGLGPASAEVQALVARAEGLIAEFTGGDEGIRTSLARMYREEGAENVMGRHGVRLPDGLWAYYAQALEYRAGAGSRGAGAKGAP